MWLLETIVAGGINLWAGWQRELLRNGLSLGVRTVVTFIAVLFVVRWTGKRSVASLAPFDLALVILIGEAAAIPVADLRVELIHGILPVVLMGLLHVLMTTVNLHSRTFERLTEGTPTLLVKEGRVLRQNLLKERVSLADLETALRHKEVNDVSRVHEAWMEPAGGISVIARPPQTGEGGVAPELAETIDRIVAHHNAQLRTELEALLRNRLGTSGGEGPCAPSCSSSTDSASAATTPPPIH